MKNILILNGSPRKKGNTSALTASFKEGARAGGSNTEEIFTGDLNLKFCQGCLRCNILGYCSLRDDDWSGLSKKTEDADVLVFASPVYFHHVTAQMKRLLDRFRSFIKIRITGEGLEHTPRHKWNKEIVLLLVMGSSDDADAEPVIDLFKFMIEIMGGESNLHIIKATRLAVAGQISMDINKLEELYPKLGLDPGNASRDFNKNRKLLGKAYELGRKLSN